MLRRMNRLYLLGASFFEVAIAVAKCIAAQRVSEMWRMLLRKRNMKNMLISAGHETASIHVILSSLRGARLRIIITDSYHVCWHDDHEKEEEDVHDNKICVFLLRYLNYRANSISPGLRTKRRVINCVNNWDINCDLYAPIHRATRDNEYIMRDWSRINILVT